ncbi:MAG: hypothetical protein SNJ70_10280 [Armatimonadota bacterium]
MNKRLLVFIIFLLIGMGIVYRISTPPRVIVPGPVGDMPVWSSKNAIGKMTGQALLSNQKKWAGVWHDVEPNGTHVCAVWIIDLEKPSAEHVLLADDTIPLFIGWKDNNTIRLVVERHPINKQKYTEIVYIDAKDTKIISKEKTKAFVEAVYAWLEGDDNFFGKSIINEKESFVGMHKKDATKVNIFNTENITNILDSDISNFVFSKNKTEAAFISSKKNERKLMYIQASGLTKELDVIDDIPGRVEDMWVSDKGILILWAAGDKIGTLAWKAPAISESMGLAEEVKQTADEIKLVKEYNLIDFPTAPKTIMLITYNGGYEIDLKTGKKKELFSYKKLPRTDQYWRAEVQDGRLYETKDGYISISTAFNTVDIRQLDKNGKKKYDILARK